MGNHICNNIQAVRINRGYSQADLAEKINLSANHYGKIERGKATLTEKNFTKICEALQTTPKVLNGQRLNILFTNPEELS